MKLDDQKHVRILEINPRISGNNCKHHHAFLGTVLTYAYAVQHDMLQATPGRAPRPWYKNKQRPEDDLLYSIVLQEQLLADTGSVPRAVMRGIPAGYYEYPIDTAPFIAKLPVQNFNMSVEYKESEYFLHRSNQSEISILHLLDYFKKWT